MLTFLAFVVALALLIAVHEYGHYRVAVLCGVKVLRFSIGFGKPLLRWQSRKDGTEFVLCALPLGGYVRMLDEREGPVAPQERHLAFNTQSLAARAAIVAAGPVANLLLAVFLYALVSWIGVQEARPIVSTPVAQSLAERAGVRAGEWVLRAAQPEEDPQEVLSFEDLRWRLTQAAMARQDLHLWVASGPQGTGREVVLPLSTLEIQDVDAELFQRIGFHAPWTEPLIAGVLPEGAAAAAGVREGDRVLRVDERPVTDAQQLRAWIRQGVDSRGVGQAQTWEIERGGQTLHLRVQPLAEQSDGQWVGRVGAYIGGQPAMATVRLGPWDGLARGVLRTWEVSELTLGVMGRMLIGDASIRNLSGPLTIADYAGRSASLGLTSYLLFLALISVSLGVLNLLPLPVLDGGHLMYYLWEGLTGKPVPEVWMDRLQRGGVAVLLVLMSLALFNDLARLLG